MKSLLIAAALALPVAPALAQPAPPPPGGPDRGPDAGEMARHKADMARDLAIVLALKPAQQPALDQWLAAMAPPPPPPGGPEGMKPGAEATTPEKLQRREAHLAERQRHEQAEIEATKRFYATLDPHQKQVFDALGRLRHEGRHGGPGPHHGPEGRGPGGPGDHGPGAPRPAG
jgi:hypothetical protein